MEKKNLTQIIDKYHLNGMVESVTWKSTDEGVTVGFVTPTKDCAGSVVHNEDLGLGENNISIYSTSQFSKLLSVMDTFMTAEVVVGTQGIPYQLKLKDNNFDLDYYLSSTDLIPDVPTINEPEEYEVQFDIDEDFIRNFVKAHTALDKPNRFTINCLVEDDEKFIELTVGDGTSFANKIKLRQRAEYELGTSELPFSANVLREILSSNKTATGVGYINEQGLLKLEFVEENTTSTYFMVRLAE